jgi:hypothetical protein
MLTHCVFYWLIDDITPADREHFEKTLEAFVKFPCVVHGTVGTPAPTPAKPVIDVSYDRALVVMLKDMAAHDAYQNHPLHAAFREGPAKRIIKKVLIYDFA